MTLDPDRPPETMTGLPTQKVAARAEIRRRLVEQWRPLLQASGLKFEEAAWGIDLDPYDHDAVTGSLTVSFGKADESESEWDGVQAKMTAAAQATGWGQAGVSHGMNLRKDPFFLNGGCGGFGGCIYTIKTSDIRQNLADNNFINVPVDELDQFRDPSAPTETSTR